MSLQDLDAVVSGIDYSKCLWKRPYLTGGGLCASEFEMGEHAALDLAEKITT